MSKAVVPAFLVLQCHEVRTKTKAQAWRIQATDDTIAKLGVIAESLGGSVSANGVAAMAVYEFAQVPAKAIWLALGAIRQFSASPETLPAPKKPIAGELSR